MDWRKSVVFSRKPEDILQMGLYELYALLGVNNTRDDLADGTRNLLETVTFDFLAANGLSSEEAQSWIRQDIKDARFVYPNESEGALLQGFLISYVSSAMVSGFPYAPPALAVTVRRAQLVNPVAAPVLCKLFENSAEAAKEVISRGLSTVYNRGLAVRFRNIGRETFGLPELKL